MNPTAEKILRQKAIELAEAWQNRADTLLKNDEKQYQKQIKYLLTHPRSSTQIR